MKNKSKRRLHRIVCLSAILALAFLFSGAGRTIVKAEMVQEEPLSSDLTLISGAMKLDSKRWIQSYTKDSKYYYFIQMTNPYKGHLRITRVKYSGFGKYSKDHMDLLYFGHGSNIDCACVGGTTYLWTGSDARSNSDVSRSISCFTYRKNAVLRRHASIRYRIPKGKKGKYVTNVYPAVSEDNKKLAVRYTYGGKQYYQIYNLSSGKKINTRKLIRQRSVSKTAGDFQGFDLYRDQIYTIEGSPTKLFLKGYDKRRKFQPTIIRTCNYRNGRKTSRVIRGAAGLTFREPEGIKVSSGGTIQIMFVSDKLTDMSCNIYQVK